MESAQAKLSESVLRQESLKSWLCQSAGVPSIVLQPLKGDASSRLYYRIYVRGLSYVVMDAPPPNENVATFVLIAQALREIGLQVPEIFEADLKQGFLLLTDMGDSTYLNALNSANSDLLYDSALDALSVLQACQFVDGYQVPPFTADFMWQEWAWHKEWFLERWLGLDYHTVQGELDHCYDQLVHAAINQPQVFMHRDYHSANLMVLKDHQTGILDFQDAFIGPLTYDLVSLLRDCYIDWPEAKVLHWVSSYYQKLKERGVLHLPDAKQLMRWFDWMGVQRHLKALLTFARKAVRDHEPRYLIHVPRTMRYLGEVTRRYPELEALHAFLRCTVSPKIKQVMP